MKVTRVTLAKILKNDLMISHVIQHSSHPHHDTTYHLCCIVFFVCHEKQMCKMHNFSLVDWHDDKTLLFIICHLCVCGSKQMGQLLPHLLWNDPRLVSKSLHLVWLSPGLISLLGRFFGNSVLALFEEIIPLLQQFICPSVLISVWLWAYFCKPTTSLWC